MKIIVFLLSLTLTITCLAAALSTYLIINGL